MESEILQKCLSSLSYLSDPRSGVGTDVAGEDGNKNSAAEVEVTILAEFMPATVSRSDVAEASNTSSVAEEEEITILAEFMHDTMSRSDVPEAGNTSSVAEEEEITILAEFMHDTMSRSDVPEAGNTSSVAEEEEVTILAEFMHATMSRAQSQPSVSVNDISANLTEEATGSQNTRDSDPEIEVVSCVLVLSHLCVARMCPMSVLSVVY